MKPKKLLLIACVFTLLFGSQKEIKALDIHDCKCVPLTLRYKVQDIHGTRDTLVSANQDSSVVLDTCGIKFDFQYENCGDIYKYIRNYSQDEFRERQYAKRHWTVNFDVDAIHIPKAPMDTIIEVTWEAIDTAYSGIRQGFQNLEQKYGNFILRKMNPHYGNGEFSQTFRLYFYDYFNVINVSMDINNIPHTRGSFSNDAFAELTSAVEDNQFKDNMEFHIYPNPSQTKINITFNNLLKNKYLEFYNKAGILMKKENLNIDSNEFLLDISDIPNGVYFICIDKECQKIVIVR